mgnify:FL=1
MLVDPLDLLFYKMSDDILYAISVDLMNEIIIISMKKKDNTFHNA